VKVQGYILQCNLPPITCSKQYVIFICKYCQPELMLMFTNRLTQNPLVAKQSVVLTGLGCETFDQAARAILEIHSMFASSLPANSLQSWRPQKDSGDVCIEFSNRYLTRSRYSESALVELSPDVDPKGVIATCMQNLEAEHTEDNEVLYFERVVEKHNQ
jgi:hypothetical protein